MLKNYIGIDIGGMTIKGIIIDGQGKILFEDVIPTDAGKGENAIGDNVVELVNRMIINSKLYKNDFAGIGIGSPGLIDSERGNIVFAGNLMLNNYPLAKYVSERVGMPVKLTNDANAAALGEAKFGSGIKCRDSILVTLGTGVGGGIISEGKLFEGGKSAGAEIGHMVIVVDGERCSCGRKGCFESYASATALMEQTKRAMQQNKDSLMWQKYTLDSVSGATAFEYADKDETAKQVVETYVKYLACGIINLVNVFRPQVVMLGGGVSAQGEKLTRPVQEIVNKEVFASSYAPVKIVTAKLGNKAGGIGAAALFM